MKLYQTKEGYLIGFYQEMGGAVQCVTFRDVYEQQLVTKTRQEEVIVPGHFEPVPKKVPGYWKEEQVWVDGHYERQMVWHPEYSVTRYREVPGHYEIQSIWVPEYTVTRYYWREAHPARGLEAAWIPYEAVIPAGFKDQRVWVDIYMEPYKEIIPAGEKETRVYVQGKYVTEKVWVPETTVTEQVWVPPEKTYKTVKYQELEQVWVGQEPIFEFLDPSAVRQYEIEQLVPSGIVGPAADDDIIIRHVESGLVIETTAQYLGLAEQIDYNEYVLP